MREISLHYSNFLLIKKKIQYVKFDNNTKLAVDEKTWDWQKPCLMHSLPQKKKIQTSFLSQEPSFYLPSPLHFRIQFFPLDSLSHKGFNSLHLTPSASPFMILPFFRIQFQFGHKLLLYCLPPYIINT